MNHRLKADLDTLRADKRRVRDIPKKELKPICEAHGLSELTLMHMVAGDSLAVCRG